MKQNRFFNCELRALETEQGVVLEGRPVVYNSRTNIGGFFDEIILLRHDLPPGGPLP